MVMKPTNIIVYYTQNIYLAKIMIVFNK